MGIDIAKIFQLARFRNFRALMIFHKSIVKNICNFNNCGLHKKIVGKIHYRIQLIKFCKSLL